MSLTVADLMKLPSLRRAKVLAGHRGLERIVATISVLEYATTTEIQKRLYKSIDFLGSELVITGFCSVAEDVDAQCANIETLAAAGEVGIILYYVGIIMPAVDPQLIKLCDALDFVLICMPENEPSLRYSEVIFEVMNAIVRDELNNPTFALDLLEQMTRLPTEYRTVKTMLRITSDRLRATAVITDSDYHILSAAPWPRTRLSACESFVALAAKLPASEHCREIPGDYPIWIYREEIDLGGDGNMLLLVFAESGKLDPQLWRQTVEGVRLSMGVWGRKHDKVDMSELVRAIVQDEPIKMRRLGELYHIAVDALSDIWIIRSPAGENLAGWVREVRSLSANYAEISLCESYEEDILVFPIGSRPLKETEEWAGALADFFAKRGASAMVTRCSLLRHTADVKYAYETNKACLKDAMRIFPLRRCFTLAEIEFVRECRETAAAGKPRIEWYTSMLQPILARRDGADIVRTLAVYLLDRNSSIMETAAQLFVHKNTVKYRLQKAGDILGFHIGDVPQSKDLMYALSLVRLMRPFRDGSVK